MSRSIVQRFFSMSMSIGAVMLAALALGGAAAAQDYKPIPYQILDPLDPIAQLYWSDANEALTFESQRPHRVYLAEVEHPMGTLVFTSWNGPGMCGINTCSLRIFDSGVFMGGAEACDDPGDHLVDSSGQFVRLCSEMARPVANLFWNRAPLRAVNTLAQWTADPVVHLNHNGSVMAVNPAEGTIRYAKVRDGLRHIVADGTILFEGAPWSAGGPFEGVAYTFRAGCAPAPYDVTAGYEDYSETLVLRGAAPVRAQSGCAVTHYSAESGNAVLEFHWSFD